MTRKLEDLFDLADFDQPAEGEVEVSTEIQHNNQQIQELDSNLDKIDAALPTVRNINASDKEMDDLAKLATENFNELMQLGMDVEPRFGAEIFSTASSMLGHAITAKNNKMTNKLKIVQLQLQKARLDVMKNKADESAPPEGQASEIDRNTLLAQIIDMNKNKDSDK